MQLTPDYLSSLIAEDAKAHGDTCQALHSPGQLAQIDLGHEASVLLEKSTTLLRSVFLMGGEPAAPAVVAVVVAWHPGPWFDEVLESLARQDYANLSVYVMAVGDDGSTKERVAKLLPAAKVAPLDEGLSFPEAANKGVASVDGAAHVLVCHDDVAFAPDAVRAMLEEAYRSNAGLTCPKWVVWSAPDHLLSVGMGADHFGVTHSLVEPGELDQGQHDAVREIFVAPSGAVLVRTDLWRALGGFGPNWGGRGEDLDLSWRAHLAGARVVVAPQAVVRHLEATKSGLREHTGRRAEKGQGREGARGGESTRGGEGAEGAGSGENGATRQTAEENRLRSLWTCYSWPLLVVLFPVTALFALGEVAWALAHRGPRREVFSPIVALAASLGHPRELWARRRRAQSLRRASDFTLWKAQTKGSARLRAMLRARLEKGHEIAWAASRARLSWRWALPTASFVVAIALVGSRHVLGQQLPLVGHLPSVSGAVPSGVGAWWHQWWSGGGLSGFGSRSLAPPGLLLMGLAGIISLGSSNFAVHILVLGPLVLGPLGVYVAARRLGSARGRLAATLLYAAVPVPYNALAQGHWAGLVSYAVSPWLLSGLCMLGGQAPFGFLPWGTAWPRFLGLGLSLALAASLAPALVLVVPVLGVALFAGSWLSARGEGSVRFLLAGTLVGAVAYLALSPWSETLHTWAAFTSSAGTAAPPMGVWEVFRMQSGPYGAGVLGLALALAAAVPVLIGRSWRLEWAGRFWAVALTFLAFSWLVSRGSLQGPDLEVLLAPAAAALVLAVALGAAAVEIDLVGYRFGWRQIVPPLGAAAALAALLPLFGWASNGQWDLPASGAEAAFGFPSATPSGDYRVLWFGSAAALPIAPEGSLPGAGGVSFAASTDGLPAATQLWPASPSGQTQAVGQYLSWAVAGETTQLGRLLGALSVRYVVVPTSSPAGGARGVAPGVLLSALSRQVDLVPVGIDPSYVVFENSSWVPVFSLVPTSGVNGLAHDATAKSAWDFATQLQQLVLLPSGSIALAGRPEASFSYAASGSRGGAPVLLGTVPRGAWDVSVGARMAAAQPVDGLATFWASLPSKGKRSAPAAMLRQTGMGGQHLADVAMLVLWAGCLVAARARRRRGALSRLTKAQLDAGAPGDEVLEIDWEPLMDGESVG